MDNLLFEEFDEKYLEASWKWLNDSEVLELIMSTRVTKEAQAKWFSELKSRKDYYIWGIRYEAVRIGAVGIKHIDYQNQIGEYFGYIGEKAYRGRGIGHEMVNMSIRKALEIGLLKLELKVSTTNIRAIRLYEKHHYRLVNSDGVINYMELDL